MQLMNGTTSQLFESVGWPEQVEGAISDGAFSFGVGLKMHFGLAVGAPAFSDRCGVDALRRSRVKGWKRCSPPSVDGAGGPAGERSTGSSQRHVRESEACARAIVSQSAEAPFQYSVSQYSRYAALLGACYGRDSA